MKVVGIRELKSRLSEYIRSVRGGEEVLVTDRGEVVAVLKRPSSLDSLPGLSPHRAALLRRGGVRPGAPNDAAIYEELPSRLPPGTAARLLDAERGER